MPLTPWEFTGISQANEDDVSARKLLNSFLPAANNLPEITLGEKIAVFNLRDESEARLTVPMVKQYFDTAVRHEEKAHQVEALTKAMGSLGLEAKPVTPKL